MAGSTMPHRNDAHYHAIRLTETWRQFEAAMRAKARDPATQREAEDAKRRRETTYARGELGGS